MAITYQAGKNGKVTSTEMLAILAVWTSNFPMQIFDITAFGNVGWRQKLGGLLDSNGSAGGFVNGALAGTLSTPITARSAIGVALVLGFDGGQSGGTPVCYASIYALISNIRTGADVNDVNRVTFDWEGSVNPATPAAPVVTWAVA